jgi:uncharacterized membrane protein YedE/YeeE
MQRPIPVPPQSLSARQAYNIVADTVGGPNVRLKDNLYQGLAILICVIAGALVGAIAVRERLAGVIVGGLIGMVAGLFGSGIFLMIYRSLRHARGRHD